MPVLDQRLIRQGCEHDTAGIAGLCGRSWTRVSEDILWAGSPSDTVQAKRAEAWGQRLRDPATNVLLAVSGRQVIGCAALGTAELPSTGRRVASLISFLVDPAENDRDTAEKLLSEAVRWARRSDCDQIIRWLYPQDHRAQSLLTVLGFQRDGGKRGRASRGRIRHVMNLRTEGGFDSPARPPGR